MNRPKTGLLGLGIATLLTALTSPLLLYGILVLPSPVRIDLGPNDRAYTQGLQQEWRFDGETSWREMGRRARLHLPVVLRGGGTLTLSVSQPDPAPVRLQARFDDETTREISIPFSQGFQKVVFELPDARIRANVRLRSDTETGAPGRLKIASIGWEGETVRPELSLVWAGGWLFALTFLALAASGASLRASAAGTLGLAAMLFFLGAENPMSSLHLIQRGPAAAAMGLLVVGLARLVSRGLKPAFLCLVYGALLLKTFLVFHLQFYFVDLPIHETLLELVYHRGLIDFWLRFPDYQVIHNLGVAPVGGLYQPFPYPTFFYLIAHLGNRMLHDPELWLKLTGALAGTLSLFPLGYLARRLSHAPRADLLAGAFYLLTPALTQSLLLLELSALAGHLFDLIVVAYLARISLDLSSWKRTLAVAALIAASATVYTSGFIHQGLLVGSCLILAPCIGGLDRRSAARLAAAGLLGATVALAFYHPRTVSNLFLAVLPAVAVTSSEVSPTLVERLLSAIARAKRFLGLALPLVGLAGWIDALRRAPTTSLRLLVAAWALSGAAGYFLRFVLLELFHFQKELYWIAAVLSVGLGVWSAHLWQRNRTGRLLASLILLAMAAAAVLWFLEMAPRFYSDYMLV